jgi:hypothetical protein
MTPVPTSLRSLWGRVVWPDARPATTAVSFVLFMSSSLIGSLAYSAC